MFRFTIRELVLVTVIVALVCGWFIDRRWLVDAYHGARLAYILEADEGERLRNTMRELGGTLPARTSDEPLAGRFRAAVE